MRASDLLGIDVAAELATLCRDQIQGSWQVPAELVRLAVARGATSLAIGSRRHGFALDATGARLAPAELAHLAVVLDGDGSLDFRHRAIVELETAGAQALLWAAGVPEATLQVACRDGETAATIRAQPRRPAIVEASATHGDSGFVVRFTSPRFDRRRALEWLRQAARFAPIPIAVDGQRLPSGFAGTLFEVALDRPVSCRLAVTRSGDAPHLWLLRHGVLATRATVPGYPPFEGAVEMAGLVPHGATPDHLRAAVNPLLTALIDRAVGLAIAAAPRLESLDEPARERLVCLLLRAARRGVRRQEIVALPLVRVRAAGDGTATLASVRDLELLAQRHGNVLASEPPNNRARRRSGGSRPVLELTTEERAVLAELVEARVERLGRGSPQPGVRRLVAAARAALMAADRPELGWPAPPAVPADELLAPERALLAELQAVLAPPWQVRFCGGDGRIRRAGRRLLLPRHSPLVTQAVRRCADDPRWLYPAVLALLGDRATAADELRARWLRRCLGS